MRKGLANIANILTSSFERNKSNSCHDDSREANKPCLNSLILNMEHESIFNHIIYGAMRKKKKTMKHKENWVNFSLSDIITYSYDLLHGVNVSEALEVYRNTFSLFPELHSLYKKMVWSFQDCWWDTIK